MGKICIDASHATHEELREILRVAKEVAITLHRTVTVYTSTKVLEVKNNEKVQEVEELEEKEKDVTKPEEKS